MKFNHPLLASVLSLFYPHVCCGCGSDLIDQESLVCLKCIASLPHTFFCPHSGNYIEKIFWGRVSLSAAYSEFYFSKVSLMQQLIHELKYRNNQPIGIYLGQIMGKSMINSNRFNKADGLIPVPLHPHKEKKRGYNQATLLCRGIASVMNIPVYEEHIIRGHFTETQTQKHRTERWKNVKESFLIQKEHELYGKQLILVDDVITTGATLEAVAHQILKVPNTILGIATLAFATK